ncbi:MAG: hypothetical protein HOM05_06610 [Proteobacteria bacterium]|jgi:regulator of protease activity HflC (stomatin/prohibitin superfamily)|nr:hypothetical protein [Pseudomonadota bacterium]
MMSALMSRLGDAGKRFSLWATWVFLILGFLLVIFWTELIRVTPVGAVSVYWYRFNLHGQNSVGPLGEGAHFVFPWDKFFTYSTRLQTHKETYPVVSAEGLHFDIKVIFRWRVIGRNVVRLNQVVGPDYLKRLLIPDIGAVARAITADFKAEALYSNRRAEIAEKIYFRLTSEKRRNGIGVRLAEKAGGNFISLKDILITTVVLPESIQAAIERKLEQKQKVEEYEFRVETEKLESERKAVEARGIAEFQRIVAPQITESYLRWRGIEATLRLSESDNSKVVVIGNSETGLPLILDTGSQSSDSSLGRSGSARQGNTAGNYSKLPAGTLPEGVSDAIKADYAQRAEVVRRARAEEAEAANWVQSQEKKAKQATSSADPNSDASESDPKNNQGAAPKASQTKTKSGSEKP